MPVQAWLGFDPRDVNGPEALRAFQVYFSLSPLVFYLLSAGLWWAIQSPGRRTRASVNASTGAMP